MNKREVVAALINAANRMDRIGLYSLADRYTHDARNILAQGAANYAPYASPQQQQALINQCLQYAVAEHRLKGNGWGLINNIIQQDEMLTPASKTQLQQQFATMAESLKNDKSQYNTGATSQQQLPQSPSPQLDPNTNMFANYARQQVPK